MRLMTPGAINDNFRLHLDFVSLLVEYILPQLTQKYSVYIRPSKSAKSLRHKFKGRIE